MQPTKSRNAEEIPHQSTHTSSFRLLLLPSLLWSRGILSLECHLNHMISKSNPLFAKSGFIALIHIYPLLMRQLFNLPQA